MRRLSLRDRVTLASTGVLALALVIVSVVGNLLLSKRLDADIDNTLQNRAAAQLVTLDSSGANLRVRESSSDAVLDEQSWVFDGSTAIERPRASTKLQSTAASLAPVNSPTFVSVGEKVRLLAKPAFSENGNRRVGTVVVGLSLEPYERTEHVSRLGTLVLDFFVLLAGALTVRWAVGRALQPVEDMTARAADWSEHDLHRRFDLGEPYDEITGLAVTLDSLLGRIDGAMRREQRLTAEIAHELRTPLSGIRAEAELALRDASPGDAQALDQIIVGTDRMNSAIETLLAAHIGEASKNRWCDPIETVAQVAEGARAAAEARHVDIEVTGTSVGRVETDQRVLAQTLAPLLDNALRHAKSTARLEVVRDGAEIVITISDDGEGIAAGSTETFFEPGTSVNGGAGLGLPLARRLARTFGAEIIARESPYGGCFELRIRGEQHAAPSSQPFRKLTGGPP